MPSVRTLLNATGYSTSGWAILIDNYYSSLGSHDVQNTDDAYLSYVWSLVLRQPGVRVGLMPDGVSAVWIAPQPSQLRKARGGELKKKAKGKSKATEEDREEEIDADAEAADVGEVEPLRDLVPIEEDVQTTPLSALREKYGDQLHIASDPKTTFAVLTGSHTRVRIFSL